MIHVFAEKDKRCHSHKVGNPRHHQNIKEDLHASSSSPTGQKKAPNAAATTALMMMANPPETLFSPGIQAKQQASPAAPSATSATAALFLATGKMMATNIP